MSEGAHMDNLFRRAKDASHISYRDIAQHIGTSSAHAVHLIHDPGRYKNIEKLLVAAKLLGISKEEAVKEWKHLRAKHVRNLAVQQLEREDL